ncbi:hypothetical protein [Halorarum salinum]|uniref:Uncharacterized protein n=1 Tax=Halorarum salinum TaxID=2743089 RepID=A0A7D5L8I7_9EURY|nr:hypothetical protein [Halobaculum salinum]QLG60255.1 hypothetical protein HUG12_00125 [Halobaculum salinum]
MVSLPSSTQTVLVELEAERIGEVARPSRGENDVLHVVPVAIGPDREASVGGFGVGDFLSLVPISSARIDMMASRFEEVIVTDVPDPEMVEQVNAVQPRAIGWSSSSSSVIGHIGYSAAR